MEMTVCSLRRLALNPAEPNGMGFFVFAYYKQFQNVLNTVAIENKEGKCVQPSPETIANGSYTPHSAGKGVK